MKTKNGRYKILNLDNKSTMQVNKVVICNAIFFHLKDL